MNQTAGASIMVAGPIFHKFMEAWFSRTPPEFFSPPEERTGEKPALRGIYREGPYVKIDKISKKLAAEYTPPELVEERGFGSIKTILAFIRRDDPQGSPPENPNDDPQFKNWQAGIERWLGINSLPRETPPWEYDNLHLPGKRPKIRIISPSSTAVPALHSVTFEIKAPFPLREVSLFLDEELKGSKTAPLTSEVVSLDFPESVTLGQHQLKIAAYDAVGNRETLVQEVLVTGN